jgi:hypothetical protein
MRAQPHTFEPELTAQPQPFAEELGTVANDDCSLSLAPEDLGCHFLAEAMEQSVLGLRDNTELERALLEDAELEGPHSSAEIALWARIVDRATHDGALFEQVRDAIAADAAAPEELSQVEPEERASDDDAVRLITTNIHEASLMDREGEEQDETLTPEIETDDAGRHTHAAAASVRP